MESDKIKIRIVVKQLNEDMSEVNTNTERQSFVALQRLRNIFSNIEKRNEEIGPTKIVQILNSAKQSEDIMATAFAEADLDEEFDEEMKVVSSVDKIIKIVKTLNQKQ